jgi:hypothetical protein
VHRFQAVCRCQLLRKQHLLGDFLLDNVAVWKQDSYSAVAYHDYGSAFDAFFSDGNSRSSYSAETGKPI